MRALTALALAVALGAACSDDEPDAACERWQAIQGEQISDTEAVEELNAIADEAENGNVRDKALDLAVLLEGVATQTEVGRAYEEMDAACQV